MIPCKNIHPCEVIIIPGLQCLVYLWHLWLWKSNNLQLDLWPDLIYNRCKEVKVNQDIALLCNLVYPDVSAAAAAAAASGGGDHSERVDFTKIVCSSLCPEQTTPAWCDKCRKYQTTVQTRRIKALPCVLSLNCGMDNLQVVHNFESTVFISFKYRRLYKILYWLIQWCPDLVDLVRHRQNVH